MATEEDPLGYSRAPSRSASRRASITTATIDTGQMMWAAKNISGDNRRGRLQLEIKLTLAIAQPTTTYAAK